MKIGGVGGANTQTGLNLELKLRLWTRKNANMKKNWQRTS